MPHTSLFLLSLFFYSSFTIHHSSFSQPTPAQIAAGYIDRGTTIDFIFGPQSTITVQGVSVNLDKRRREIKTVTVAGDFNEWDPKSSHYQMKKVGQKLYQITVQKTDIGKPGETHHFKFVLNHTFWVEPPKEATNKLTDKEGNINYTLKL